MLRDSVRKLMERHAPPEYLRRLDREQAYPYELYDAWVKAGLLSMPFPEEYGGLGGSIIDMAIVSEEIARKSPDVGMAYGGSVFCGLNVLRKGSEEQKRHWLPQASVGRDQDVDLDVGARCRLRHRRHAHERAARRRAMTSSTARNCGRPAPPPRTTSSTCM